MVKNWLLILSALIWLPSLAQAAIFTASVDRQQLSLNEKLTLTLSLSNSDVRLRAEGVDPTIDLSVLHRDFDVGVPQASNRYNIYQGRGRSTSELEIALYPKHKGQLTIPSFNVGEANTEALSIEVLALPANSAPEVFVRKGSNINTVWERQQLVVFLDIYHRVKLEKAKMSDILETEPDRIELIPHWQLPQGKSQSEQFGFNYEVLRLAWALFPETKGKFSVYLPSIDVTTQSGNQLRFPHQQLTFDIQALPSNIPKDIIIGKPDISYTRLPSQLTQHQLASWSITIKAPVAVAGLPTYLPIDAGKNEAFKIYPDRAVRETFKSSSGITDQATYTLSLMPLISGEQSITPIDVPYFDTQIGSVQLVGMPEQSFTVEASTHTNNTARGDNIPLGTPETTAQWWQFGTLLFASLWLLTVGYATLVKGKQATGDKKNILKITTQNTEIVTDEEQLKQELLNALGTKTLAEGIEKWQRNYPAEKQAIDMLIQLQQQYYGPEKGGNEENLQTLTGKILRVVERKATTIKEVEKANNWLIETFKNQRSSIH